MNDTTPLTNTYKGWALVRDDAFITTPNGRIVILGTPVIAEQWAIMYPGAKPIRIEITVGPV